MTDELFHATPVPDDQIRTDGLTPSHAPECAALSGDCSTGVFLAETETVARIWAGQLAWERGDSGEYGIWRVDLPDDGVLVSDVTNTDIDARSWGDESYIYCTDDAIPPANLTKVGSESV